MQQEVCRAGIVRDFGTRGAAPGKRDSLDVGIPRKQGMAVAGRERAGLVQRHHSSASEVQIDLAFEFLVTMGWSAPDLQRSLSLGLFDAPNSAISTGSVKCGHHHTASPRKAPSLTTQPANPS